MKHTVTQERHIKIDMFTKFEDVWINICGMASFLKSQKFNYRLYFKSLYLHSDS